MSKSVLALAMACGASMLGSMFGCAEQQRDPVTDNQEIIENLIEAGFPESDIMVVDNKVYVGRDAEVSLEASREMLEVDPSSSDEQYRTSNLVSRSLAVICVNGAAYTGKFGDALNRAITNYNNLGLTFRMQRTSGSTSGCGAVITSRVSGGTGGSSGFPSGGRPYSIINVGSGLNNFSVDTVEHVITHELGHTVGMRHSDYFNRSISCGSGGNEGSGGVGAIHIPGTPTGASVGGSLMNSCFRSSETGEFSGSDATALQTLY
jgi:hypothetical protein